MDFDPKVRDDHPWATQWFETVGDLEVGPIPSNRPWGIQIGGLVYACQFRKLTGAKRLVVSLNGSTGPSLVRPVFVRRNWAEDLEAHMLVISDPTLFLEPRLRTSVFLGNKDNDAMTGTIAIAEAVARYVRLDATRTVYWGASAGAFASIMAAIRTGSGAIALNPQIDLPEAAEAGDAQLLLETLQPGLTSDYLGHEYPERSLITESLQAAREEGRMPRLVIMQNKEDRHHYLNHYMAFCRTFDCPVEGGMDFTGTIATYVYNDPRGHMAETPRLRAHLKSTLPFATKFADTAPPPTDYVHDENDEP